jgi:uncharacterized membrane protein
VTGRPRTERGQITVLVVVFALCLLLAVAAVTDLSAGYLRQRAATSLAEGAALAAANGAAQAAVYADPDAEYVGFDAAAASAAVDRYLRQVGADRDFPGIRAEVRVEGDAVVVALAVPFELPFPVPGGPSRTTIATTASAAMPIY